MIIQQLYALSTFYVDIILAYSFLSIYNNKKTLTDKNFCLRYIDISAARVEYGYMGCLQDGTCAVYS